MTQCGNCNNIVNITGSGGLCPSCEAEEFTWQAPEVQAIMPSSADKQYTVEIRDIYELNRLYNVFFPKILLIERREKYLDLDVFFMVTSNGQLTAKGTCKWTFFGADAYICEQILERLTEPEA